MSPWGLGGEEGLVELHFIQEAELSWKGRLSQTMSRFMGGGGGGCLNMLKLLK